MAVRSYAPSHLLTCASPLLPMHRNPLPNVIRRDPTFGTHCLGAERVPITTQPNNLASTDEILDLDLFPETMDLEEFV